MTELLAELLKHIIRNAGGCWSWTGPKSWNGYGRLYWNNKMRRAHRLMWEAVNGDIPNGMWVLHHCDNPQCTNPDHLFLGTPKDNAVDRNNKGRHSDRRGEKHHMRKLSAKDVCKIRKMYALREDTQKNIGRQFGVGQQQVSLIVNGIRWNQ